MALKETEEVKAAGGPVASDGSGCRLTHGSPPSRRAALGRRKRRRHSQSPASWHHGDNASPERLAADYGLWASSYVRGELASMRRMRQPSSPASWRDPIPARRASRNPVQGITHYFAGEYVEALRELEQALALFQPGRDDDRRFAFRRIPALPRRSIWRLFCWPLGEVATWFLSLTA